MIRQALERFLDRLAPQPRPQVSPMVAERVRAKPLTIADVGAAMGVDPRFGALLPQGLCRFLTFEPDARSQEAAENGVRVFGCALGAEQGQETLFLTAGPFASSLKPHNTALLSRYAVWPWHLPAGEVQVDVARMDDVLADSPDWQPDFIKTDVEGADLDVLTGGEKTLHDALGVQAEVAFVERHTGTPLFAEIDQYLRAQGFMLFQLPGDHWLRGNLVAGPSSRPQLVWADAVYFRDIDDMRERLRALDAAGREQMLSRFVLLLVSYGAHDFAVETVQAMRAAELVAPELATALDQDIRASAQPPFAYTARQVLAVSVMSLIYLVGWPAGGRVRGVLKTLLKQRATVLFHHLYRVAGRGGLENSCYTDLP